MVKQNQEVFNSLRQLGLNEYQAKTYVALSLLGSSTAGEISDKSDVPRARAYDVLEELAQRGFAAIKNGRPVKYSALPIGEAVSTLKNLKKNKFEDELAKMEALKGTLESSMKTMTPRQDYSVEENVWTLKGRDALYSKMGSMIEKAKNHVVFSSTPFGVCRKLLHHKLALDKARGRGVRFHVVSQIPKDHEIWKTCAGALENTKIHDKSLPTRMVLSDDQALIFLTDEKTAPEDEVGVWLKSPHLVSTLKEAVPSLARI